jgi:hypothetical protein
MLWKNKPPPPQSITTFAGKARRGTLDIYSKNIYFRLALSPGEERFAKNKHSSSFCLFISDVKNRFLNVDYKFVCLLMIYQRNKLVCLSPAKVLLPGLIHNNKSRDYQRFVLVLVRLLDLSTNIRQDSRGL